MPANEGFFDRRRPPAAFKHGILSRYSPVFAAKAGSVTNGKVVFLDGYAGAGRYDDGSPGSPLLFVKAAQTMARLRDVTGIFVEQDPQRRASLREALDEADPRGVVKRVVPDDELGPVLPRLLELATGTALFVFLDPFGTALDLTQLRGQLLRRPGRAPTEVLLHFSVSTIARIGGILHRARARGQISPSERKTVARVDAFLGGQWWHPEFDALSGTDDEQALLTATDVAMRVAYRFRTGLARQTGFRSVAMPVRPDPGRVPKYVLVLFTRNVHGAWHFADTLGRAGIDWQKAVYDANVQGDADRLADRNASEPAGLFDLNTVVVPPPQFDSDAYERQHRTRWTNTIAGNIHHLLGQLGGLRLVDYVDAVYGDVLGQAWEKHVRAAVKQLHKSTLINDDGRGDDFWRRHVPVAIPHRRPTPGTDAAEPTTPPNGDLPGAEAS